MASESKLRSYYLDNLRTFLTALVIVHHTSIPNGGLGSWIYKSPYHKAFTSPALLAFNVINQTFFMAAFFLISGYFSAIATAKRSRSDFLREKWKRLGVPMAMYSILGPGPVNILIARMQEGKDWPEAMEAFWYAVKSVRGVRGGVWYTALLLIFDTLYSVLQPSDFGSTNKRYHENIQKERGHSRRREEVSGRQLFSAVLLVSLSSWILSMQWPLGTPFKPLNLNMGYLPQYILFYVTGVWANKTEIQLHNLINWQMQKFLMMTVVSITISGLLVLSANSKNSGGIDLGSMLEAGRGGFNSLAVTYAFWNNLTGILLCSFLLGVFRKRFNAKWVVGDFYIARYSYAAFLVHIPIIVTFQCLTDSSALGERTSGGMKTAGVGGISVLGSWAVGWLLVRVLEGTGAMGYV